MRFKALPVNSLEDATLDFEQIQVLNPLSSSKNLSDVTSQAAALQNLGVRRGTVTFTFSASATSGAQTVTHGFQVAPTAIVLTPSSSNFVGAVVTAVAATTFTANGFTTTNTSITSSVMFYWIAVL